MTHFSALRSRIGDGAPLRCCCLNYLCGMAGGDWQVASCTLMPTGARCCHACVMHARLGHMSGMSPWPATMRQSQQRLRCPTAALRWAWRLTGHKALPACLMGLWRSCCTGACWLTFLAAIHRVITGFSVGGPPAAVYKHMMCLCLYVCSVWRVVFFVHVSECRPRLAGGRWRTMHVALASLSKRHGVAPPRPQHALLVDSSRAGDLLS